jgi:DNA-binding transcriptional MerR regulator
MKPKQYTIENLCELTGFTRRTIRYYIQEGLLEPPAGRGRGGFYFDSHLDRLRRIKALQDEGLKLSQIQELLKIGRKPEMAPLRELWIRYPVEPGIEIHIQKQLDETERKKLAEIIRVAKSILKGGRNDD